MSAMQRLNLTAALLTFIYGALQGWPLLTSLEKALLAFVTVFGAQILIIIGLVRLSRLGRGGDASP